MIKLSTGFVRFLSEEVYLELVLLWCTQWGYWYCDSNTW